MNRRTSLFALRVSLLSAMGLGACGDALAPSGSAGSTGATGTGGAAATTGSTASSGPDTTVGAGGNPSGAGGSGGATMVTIGTGSTTTVTIGSGGSTSGAGGATVGSGGAGAGGASLGTCDAPTAVLDPFGNDTGFVKCADGTVHRAQIVGCDLTAGAPLCDGNEDAIQCATDADCGLHPHGRCAHFPSYSGPGGPQTICGCTYPCAADADCNAGEICVCSGVVASPYHPWATCGAAVCASDADCPSGECGVVFFNTGCGFGAPVLACRSAADGCRTMASCLPDIPYCSVNPSAGNTWQCIEGAPCGIGRPLLVEGRARTAPATARDDWSHVDLGVSAGGIEADLCVALARHWLAVAALEHASVASFARFTLHLLALGAPASLVADAQRAGLDEVSHARLAYGLASIYAGERFGPAALDLTGVDLCADRRAVMRALIGEACVGETLAAAEASAIAAQVIDPTLAALHARIAADEQRHAELGWRALAWLLDGAGADDTAFAARCFDEAMIAAARLRLPTTSGSASPDHGLLAPASLAAIHRDALREVVKPCAAALLGRRGEPPRAARSAGARA